MEKETGMLSFSGSSGPLNGLHRRTGKQQHRGGGTCAGSDGTE